VGMVLWFQHLIPTIVGLSSFGLDGAGVSIRLPHLLTPEKVRVCVVCDYTV